MMNAHIYLVTNQLNRRRYVGQTTVCGNKKGHGLALRKAYIKYGKDNFDYEPICKNINNRQTLNFIESFWIKTLDCRSPNGYNIESGGSTKGEVADSTKQKLRQINLGKKLSAETKAKMAAAATGKFPTEETRIKLKIARSKQIPPMLGKTLTEGTKKILSKAKIGNKNPMYGKPITDEHRAKLRSNNARNKPWLGKKRLAEHTTHLRKEYFCPHCNKIGKGNAMIRHHMDNCKFKEIQ